MSLIMQLRIIQKSFVRKKCIYAVKISNLHQNSVSKSWKWSTKKTSKCPTDLYITLLDTIDKKYKQAKKQSEIWIRIKF